MTRPAWNEITGGHWARARELRKNSTFAEDLLWQHLRGEKLNVKFRRQHPIGYYIADFYCSQLCLVVEVDGESHTDLAAREHDVNRDLYLRDSGLTVLRFTNHAVMHDLPTVIETITSAIARISSGGSSQS